MEPEWRHEPREDAPGAEGRPDPAEEASPFVQNAAGRSGSSTGWRVSRATGSGGVVSADTPIGKAAQCLGGKHRG